MQCYCDGDGPNVYSETPVRSGRKQYQCYECGCAIRVGEPSVSIWGIWDGESESFRLCSRCDAVRKYVDTHIPCFCITWGYLLENARETINEYRRECPGMGMEFGRLLVAIRQRAKKEKREQGGGE